MGYEAFLFEGKKPTEKMQNMGYKGE